MPASITGCSISNSSVSRVRITRTVGRPARRDPAPGVSRRPRPRPMPTKAPRVSMSSGPPFRQIYRPISGRSHGGTMAFRPYRFFGGNCRDALTRYQEIFGGELTLLTMKDVPGETPPADKADLIIHAALMVGDELLMASD